MISTVVLAVALAEAALAPAAAQQITATTMALAKQVARNAPDIGNFDGILPDVMQDTKMRLINVRPDLYQQISVAVEASALSLVPRRSDLDNDIATIWAMNFTDDELKAINAFFSSPAGQKYKAIAPTVGQAIITAGQNWANKLSDEMYTNSVAALQKQGFKF
jgi:hypothetical protein